MPLVVAIGRGFLLRIFKTDLCKSAKGPRARSAGCPRARRLRKGEEGIRNGLHAGGTGGICAAAGCLGSVNPSLGWP